MSKKIIYAVLNWGLGHASRSIPIIKTLQLKHEVIIASDGEALILLKKEFPELLFEELASYNVSYSKTAKNFNKTIFLQLNSFSKAIKKEYKQTQEIIKKHKITHIISDNRYGVYNDKIPSSIICHQLSLQHKNKFIQNQMNKLHYSKLNKFDEIWVPDFDNNNSIAGKISKFQYFKKFIFPSPNIQNKIKYLGLLSSLEKVNLEMEYELCVILSGPEPQRSILEKILIKQLGNYTKEIAFVRGTQIFNNNLSENKNIRIFNLIDSKKIGELINKSKLVICRAGYSSIMDLIKIKKQAILIPTPGQTEQEYLASYLKQKKWFFSRKQEDLNLKEDIEQQRKYKIPEFEISNLLEETILKFMSS